MNHNCPSCGKDVPQNASFCPHCGAPQPEAAARQTTPAAAPLSTEQGSSRTCPECGAVNPADAETCTVCGESLSAPEYNAAFAAPAGVRAAEKAPASATRIYLIAGIVVLALAAGIYWATAPDQGPPAQHQQTAMQGGNRALPPGHPPTNTGPTPEQQKMIDELKGKVASNPDDEETKLQLANVYYDANMHDEALPLYREYLKNHPDNEDARTDMAYSMYQTGDLEGAIAELKDITASAGKHQNAAYNLAMMYVVKRDRDSVQLWMKRVIEIDSTTAQAKNAREIIEALSEAHMGATAPHDTN